MTQTEAYKVINSATQKLWDRLIRQTHDNDAAEAYYLAASLRDKAENEMLYSELVDLTK